MTPVFVNVSRAENLNMASAVGRVYTHITLFSTSFGTSGLWSLRPCTVRTLSLNSQCCAKSQSSTDADEGNDLSKPIKFSTSKASHRIWKVEGSMGSGHQRPWRRVLPFSILGISFFVWCFFRQESEVDKALEKQLYEHLPELLTVMEEDEQTEVPKKDP